MRNSKNTDFLDEILYRLEISPGKLIELVVESALLFVCSIFLWVSPSKNNYWIIQLLSGFWGGDPATWVMFFCGVFGPIMSVLMLYRHIIVRYIYTFLILLRLILFFTPTIWNAFPRDFQVILNCLAIFPIFAVVSFFLIASFSSAPRSPTVEEIAERTQKEMRADYEKWERRR